MGHLGGPGGRILLLLLSDTPNRQMVKATRGKHKRVGTKVKRSTISLTTMKRTEENGRLGKQFMLV